MTRLSDTQLDKIFGALSDSTRRKILDRISTKPCSVSELIEPFSMSMPAILKHLKVLEDAGLVYQEKTGRVKMCSLEAKPMRSVAVWLGKYEVFWGKKLDNLEKFLSQKNSQRKDEE